MTPRAIGHPQPVPICIRAAAGPSSICIIFYHERFTSTKVATISKDGMGSLNALSFPFEESLILAINSLD